MGWLFHTTDYGRKAFIEERTTKYNQETETSKWECLAHSVKSNHLWKVIRYTNKMTNEVKTFVALDLIAKERNGGWGYKDMDESAGPCHYDCPLKLLAMSDEPTECFAVEWRKKVREFHETKKQQVKLEEGLEVKLYDGCQINGYSNLTAKLLYKTNKVTWMAEIYNAQGVMISSRCRMNARHIAK